MQLRGRYHAAAPTDKKGVAADKEGVGSLAHKICEGRIDFMAGAGI
jgi:hypothetical protein